LIDALNQVETQARQERKQEAQQSRVAQKAQSAAPEQETESENGSVLTQSFGGAPTWVWLVGIVALSGAAVMYHNKKKKAVSK
jgi:hypothetical protein